VGDEFAKCRGSLCGIGFHDCKFTPESCVAIMGYLPHPRLTGRRAGTGFTPAATQRSRSRRRVSLPKSSSPHLFKSVPLITTDDVRAQKESIQ
jgi:hypothetical protein